MPCKQSLATAGAHCAYTLWIWCFPTCCPLCLPFLLLSQYSARVMLPCCSGVAEPDFRVEDEVLSGRLHGSMVSEHCCLFEFLS